MSSNVNVLLFLSWYYSADLVLFGANKLFYTKNLLVRNVTAMFKDKGSLAFFHERQRTRYNDIKCVKPRRPARDPKLTNHTAQHLTHIHTDSFPYKK